MPDLDARLARLADDVAGAARPLRAAQIRGRGDRQRTRAVASAAVGLGVLAIAGGVAVAASPPPTQHGPARPSPSRVSPSVQATVIPQTLPLPHDHDGRWKRDDNAAIPSAFLPCVTTDPTVTGRTDAVTMTGPGNPDEETHSPAHITDQLFLYRNDDAADKALLALGQQAVECDWHGGLTDGTIYGLHTIIARKYMGPLLHDAFVMRRGNALLISYDVVQGAWMSSGDLDAMAKLADDLCSLMGQCEQPDMCLIPMPSPTPQTAIPCPDPPPTVPPATVPSPGGPTRGGGGRYPTPAVPSPAGPSGGGGGGG
jgi:hypothetical protein